MSFALPATDRELKGSTKVTQPEAEKQGSKAVSSGHQAPPVSPSSHQRSFVQSHLFTGRAAPASEIRDPLLGLRLLLPGWR